MRKIQLIFAAILAISYQGLKKILFLINPEAVHQFIVKSAELIGKLPILTALLSKVLNPAYPLLSQKLGNIKFLTPVGLAAGFDYEARLTQVLYCLGFGFQTIGTITYQQCAGNAPPRLSRLSLSKSLLVDKGFKNPGARAIIRKLSDYNFHNPVGISIGQTNTPSLNSRSKVTEDILNAFKLFEKSKLRHQYYELNISCPNLRTRINFYHPENLGQLLIQVDKLHLKRPLFVKMPINESDKDTLSLLKVISKHTPVGVIIGNLQKNRFDSSVAVNERSGLGIGNLSGKPTFKRSNHLIALTYRQFSKRFIIIGCGGVFTPEDAYIKICLGASLLQMITGLVFQGPQIVAQINQGLARFLRNDGFTHLSEAVGSRNHQYFQS